MLMLFFTANSCAASFEGDTARSFNRYAQQLHERLLGVNAGYVKSIPPVSQRSVLYSRAGTNVDLGIRFFKVDRVSSANGRMRLKVWLRTSWVDERLAWNPADFGNITFFPAVSKSISDPEETEIWVPDLKMYNSGDSIVSTFDPSNAMVYSSGFVFWSRPGTLDVLCKFSGLVAFPFDQLECAVDFGGWSLSGFYQGIELMGSGYELHDSNKEASAGNTYQEYAIEHVTVSVNSTYYPCCPNEPWPLITYWVSLDRASFYYYNAIIVPGCVFTYLSFFAFFMSHEVGERLGFCITLILATEVSKVVISSMVPVCGELLWVEIFNLLNFTVTVISLSVSVLTLWFAYRTDEWEWLLAVSTSAFRIRTRAPCCNLLTSVCSTLNTRRGRGSLAGSVGVRLHQRRGLRSH